MLSSTSTLLGVKYGQIIPTNIAGSLSGDLAVLLSLFIILAALTYYFGRGLMISLIISFYPAGILYKTFPFAEKMLVLTGDKMVFINKLGIFLIFLIPITIIVNRYIFSASDYDSRGNIVKILGLSLAFLIVLILFSYSVVNYDTFHNFGPQIDALFSGSSKEFYWSLAPLLLLAIL